MGKPSKATVFAPAACDSNRLALSFSSAAYRWRRPLSDSSVRTAARLFDRRDKSRKASTYRSSFSLLIGVSMEAPLNTDSTVGVGLSFCIVSYRLRVHHRLAVYFADTP